MRTHLRRTTDGSGEETYEILFGPSLKALDRHFGGLNEKHTAALALDKLRQANQEFASYYADFQGLMDILETTGVLSALRQGYGPIHKRIVACENAERDVRGHRRTQAIRGWPGPSVDGLVSVYGLAIAGHPRMAWPSPLKPKHSE